MPSCEGIKPLGLAAESQVIKATPAKMKKYLFDFKEIIKLCLIKLT
jgi:hypothetical protein